MAAARTGVPSSTLSRRIAELEAGLGTQLLVRTTRRVDLTEAGALFLSRCQEIVEAARGAQAELSDLARRPRGTLRISLTQDFGTTFLAPVIAAFCTSHPEIALQLDLSPHRADIMAEGVDVAIRVGLPREPYLFARKLIMARRGLYASPAYLDAAGAPTTSKIFSTIAACACPRASPRLGFCTGAIRPRRLRYMVRFRQIPPA